MSGISERKRAEVERGVTGVAVLAAVVCVGVRVNDFMLVVVVGVENVFGMWVVVGEGGHRISRIGVTVAGIGGTAGG